MDVQSGVCSRLSLRAPLRCHRHPPARLDRYRPNEIRLSLSASAVCFTSASSVQQQSTHSTTSTRSITHATAHSSPRSALPPTSSRPCRRSRSPPLLRRPCAAALRTPSRRWKSRMRRSAAGVGVGPYRQSRAAGEEQTRERRGGQTVESARTKMLLQRDRRLNPVCNVSAARVLLPAAIHPSSPS